jgi:hypothetical protein
MGRLFTGLVGSAAITACAMAPAWGQARYHAPKTLTGAPDLQGTWTNQSLTKLERPTGVSALVLDEPAATALEKRLSDESARVNDGVGGRESEWWGTSRLARIDGKARTSWIVSPPDGKAPYLAEARRTMTARIGAAGRDFDNPDGRSVSDRCLAGAWAGSGTPMLNSPYNANYQIVQTRDAVALLSELNHDLRIIRLGVAPAPTELHPWMGDSIGHWDGDTLVVETTNFSETDVLRPQGFWMSKDAHITERFTRVSADEIVYRFTVDDPKTYSQPWSAEMPFRATTGAIYESACHEGNYSLAAILSGARQAEMAPKP